MAKKRFWVWVPEYFPDWLRQRVKEEYGTTYGTLSDVVVRACENWFNDLQNSRTSHCSSSSTKSTNAMSNILKGFDPRVRHNLDLMLGRMVLEYEREVTEPGLDHMIDRFCSRNHSIAAYRTRRRYKEILLSERFIIPDRVSDSGVQIFKVNHDDIKDFQSSLHTVGMS